MVVMTVIAVIIVTGIVIYLVVPGIIPAIVPGVVSTPIVPVVIAVPMVPVAVGAVIPRVIGTIVVIVIPGAGPAAIVIVVRLIVIIVDVQLTAVFHYHIQITVFRDMGGEVLVVETADALAVLILLIGLVLLGTDQDGIRLKLRILDGGGSQGRGTAVVLVHIACRGSVDHLFFGSLNLGCGGSGCLILLLGILGMIVKIVFVRLCNDQTRPEQACQQNCQCQNPGFHKAHF